MNNICPHCGNILVDDEKVCSKCGYVFINSLQNNELINEDKSAFSNNSNSVFVFNSGDHKRPRKFGQGLILGTAIGLLIGGIVGAVIMNSIHRVKEITGDMRYSSEQQQLEENIESNNVEAVIRESNDDSVTDEMSKGNMTVVPMGEEISVHTEDGTFSVSIDEIKTAEWADSNTHSENQKIISVNCTAANNDIAPEVFNGLDLWRYFTVTDNEGFDCEYYDIIGPDNGEYQLNYTIPAGNKAKVGITYKVPKDCKEFKVRINNQYTVSFPEKKDNSKNESVDDKTAYSVTENNRQPVLYDDDGIYIAVEKFMYVQDASDMELYFDIENASQNILEFGFSDIEIDGVQMDMQFENSKEYKVGRVSSIYRISLEDLINNGITDFDKITCKIHGKLKNGDTLFEKKLLIDRDAFVGYE